MDNKRGGKGKSAGGFGRYTAGGLLDTDVWDVCGLVCHAW